MTTVAKSPDQLREENERRLREIVEKTGKTPAELYAERETRIRDAIELRQPDRAPVIMAGSYFAARYAGLTASSVYYDPAAYKEAVKKTALDFEPDLIRGAAGASAGSALAILDAKQTAWPGGTLPPDVTHQFIEGEYMKGDEYDLFLADPTDFTLRYYLPRTLGAAAPLAQLPPVMGMAGYGLTGIIEVFLRPEFREMGEKLVAAAREQEKWRQVMSTLEEEMAAIGFPQLLGGAGVGGSPFDAISDFYRGMRGSMLDMYRRPEKLLAACDKILEMRLARGVPVDPTKARGPQLAFMPLHRGAESFMSRSQFEKFYWPSLKRTIVAATDLGYVAMPFFEGHFGDRLEYLLELPKGKVVCHFEHTDMARAKAVLGGHLCIMGNVPSSILQIGSPREVEEYCKNLIEACGEGGGFILTHGSSIDEAKPANVKAMVDSVKKYGW